MGEGGWLPQQRPTFRASPPSGYVGGGAPIVVHTATAIAKAATM